MYYGVYNRKLLNPNIYRFTLHHHFYIHKENFYSFLELKAWKAIEFRRLHKLRYKKYTVPWAQNNTQANVQHINKYNLITRRKSSVFSDRLRGSFRRDSLFNHNRRHSSFRFSFDEDEEQQDTIKQFPSVGILRRNSSTNFQVEIEDETQMSLRRTVRFIKI